MDKREQIARMAQTKEDEILLARVYERITSGHFTPPVKLGRASVWPEDEVSTIISASISGQSPEEIKVLVANLVKARKQI